MNLGRAVRPALIAALLVVGAVGVPAPTSAATLPVPVAATLAPCDMRGSGTPPDRIVHRSATGVKKATYTPTSSGGFPPSDWVVVCAPQVLAPGDTLSFLDLSDPGQPVLIQKVTMPRMTAVADRVRGRVTGVAAGVTEVAVSLADCPFIAPACETRDIGTVQVGAKGAYLYAPALTITGSGQVWVVRNKNGLVLRVVAPFPRLITTLGSASVRGTGNPGAGVTVRVDRAGTAASATARTSAVRSFKGIVKRNGVARKLQTGDRVRWYLGGTLQGDFVVPALDMVIGPTHTEGRCFANGTVAIQATSPDKASGVAASGTSAADRSFDIDIVVPSGWTVVVQCRTKVGDVVVMKGIAGT